nr:RDD family protein [Shewanella sp. Isolate11]
MAFNIAPNVLYTPLASPFKRGVAILIDGLLISVLAEQAGFIFILLVALTILIERRSHQIGEVLKWCLYLSMLIMAIFVTSDNLIDYQSSEDTVPRTSEETVKIDDPDVAAFISIIDIIALKSCEDFICIDKHFNQIADLLNSTEMTSKKKRRVLGDLVEDLDLTEPQRHALERIVDNKVPQTKASETIDEHNESEAQSELSPDPQALVDEVIDTQLPNKKLELEDSDQDKGSNYSIINWAKGLLNDLGLGFGWAAFYFTVFIAWFDGQTLGKKLLNIRVIKLDSSPITLWGAFGRYGGYGAGFATGLLGFMQILWDANRQAIQDKISATVVIDLSKAKQLTEEDKAQLGYQ